MNADAIGFHITNFDIGVMVMAAFDPLGLDLGLYLAAKASASGVGLVGVDGLSASGRFDVELNVGIGASGLALDLEVVDFKASFSEVRVLFDTDNDGSVTVAELRTLAGQDDTGALPGLYTGTALGTDVVSLATLVAALDATSAGGNNDGRLQVSEAQALLSSENDSQAVAADKAGDGVLDSDGAFAVNTGNPTAPVVLDFDELLINFRLGGSITVFSDAAKTTPVVKLNGLLLFEVTDAGLKAFVVAGLEFGPDIGSSSKFFSMNALGAVVINGDGIAADIDVSVTIGAALPDLSLDAGAHARLVLNTTGQVQSITIPEQYVGFLDGTLDLSSSALGSALTAQGGVNVAALESLVAGGTLDNRFTSNSDGSLTFSISANAPTMASLFPDATLLAGSALVSAGPYFAVAISAHLGIGGFTLEGRFGLIVGADGLQLLVEAKMSFFNAVQLNIKGQANFVTTPGSVGLVLKIGASLNAGTDAFGMPGLFSFKADLQLQMNTRPPLPLGGTLDDKDLSIERHSFRIDVKNAKLTLLSIIELDGSGFVEVTQGVFRMDVHLSGKFLSIVSVSAHAFFSSEGEFQITLDGQIQLGPDCFNINGSAHLDVSYLDNKACQGDDTERHRIADRWRGALLHQRELHAHRFVRRLHRRDHGQRRPGSGAGHCLGARRPRHFRVDRHSVSHDRDEVPDVHDRDAEPEHAAGAGTRPGRRGWRADVERRLPGESHEARLAHERNQRGRQHRGRRRRNDERDEKDQDHDVRRGEDVQQRQGDPDRRHGGR